MQQDGVNTQSYGVTNYLIFASTGASMTASDLGISSGWGGLRTTPQFYALFKDGDTRELFWEEGHQAEIEDMSKFEHGMASRNSRTSRATEHQVRRTVS